VALGPILEMIGSLTERIREYDRQLETISKEHCPETDLLARLKGLKRLQRLPLCSLWRILLALQRAERWEHAPGTGACQGSYGGCEDKTRDHASRNSRVFLLIYPPFGQHSTPERRSLAGYRCGVVVVDLDPEDALPSVVLT
jgi:hypothetical protein